MAGRHTQAKDLTDAGRGSERTAFNSAAQMKRSRNQTGATAGASEIRTEWAGRKRR